MRTALRSAFVALSGHFLELARLASVAIRSVEIDVGGAATLDLLAT